MGERLEPQRFVSPVQAELRARTMTALHAFCRSPQTIGHARPSHCATPAESPSHGRAGRSRKVVAWSPPIERLTVPQFANLIIAAKATLTRKIVAVHLHHTWRPRRTDFRGRTTVEAMRRFHMVENGWSDIAQHLTIDPQGWLWTGRNWNRAAASQTGHNGTRLEGPFMIEMVTTSIAMLKRFDGRVRRHPRGLAHLLREFGSEPRHPFPPRAGMAEVLSRQRRRPGPASSPTLRRPSRRRRPPSPTPWRRRSAKAKRACAVPRRRGPRGSVAAPWDGPWKTGPCPKARRRAGAVARMSGVVVAGMVRHPRVVAGPCSGARHRPDQRACFAQRLVQDSAGRARGDGRPDSTTSP